MPPLRSCPAPIVRMLFREEAAGQLPGPGSAPAERSVSRRQPGGRTHGWLPGSGNQDRHHRDRRDPGLPRGRERGLDPARAPAALPRLTRQLGSRADRRARHQSQGNRLRQRRCGRVNRPDAQQRGRDGDGRGCLCIRPWPGQLRPARLLHRQLHRPGNAADGSRPHQVRSAGEFGACRRRRHARLG